jgi:hypothetical protein
MPEDDDTPINLDICPVCGRVVADGDTATIYRVQLPEGASGAPLVMLHPECAAKGAPNPTP